MIPMQTLQGTFAENFKWQYQFTPQLKRIWQEVLFKHGDLLIAEASLEQDRKEETDMIILAVNPNVQLANRVRSYNHYMSFESDFAIRNSGRVTELQKIVDRGFRDYFLYAFADQYDRNLIAWFVGDLEIFRKEYRHARKVIALGFNQRRIRWTEIDPPGGSPFLAFELETFPPEFIVASYNHRFVPKGEGGIECRSSST